MENNNQVYHVNLNYFAVMIGFLLSMMQDTPLIPKYLVLLAVSAIFTGHLNTLNTFFPH